MSKLIRKTICSIAAGLLLLAALTQAAPAAGGHDDLVGLFEEWREFEVPDLRDGAPDYTVAATERKHAALKNYQQRLASIDPSNWPIDEQVDYHLVRAEMNGAEFQLRVLRPWARDPAFYASVIASQSDTPAEEGPTIHHAIRLWEYSIWPRTAISVTSPLTAQAESKLAAQLRAIPSLLQQARGNLIGNARDLWLAGIRTMESQRDVLDRLDGLTGDAGDELKQAIEAARGATDSFVSWLKQQAPSKSGASGIGREHYTWHLRNVLLVPLTWEEEVTLMRRELARAHAALQFEQQRNRDLPPLDPVAGPEEFKLMQDESISRYMRFLEENEILPILDYMEPALREQVFPFYPEDIRHFFHQATHRDPRTLWTHFYHYWDLAQMIHDPHPSPIRREALLYNIWMSRAEGLATAMEEWMMQAGLYDDNPRAREIVWIMLATRAARGLASLYAHDNQLSMEQAGDLHVEWTPRGWMRRDLELLGFEQHLYLRQPGYGPSYLTGKHLLEQLMAERARQLGEGFTLKGFYEELNTAGLIPVSLISWQLTGTPMQASMYTPAGD